MNVLFSLLLALVLILHACGQQTEPLMGTYQAQGTDVVPLPVTLVLGVEGKATLSMDGEDTSLQWGRGHAGESFLHTREGGVLAVRIMGDNLDLVPPGGEHLDFKKAQNP